MEQATTKEVSENPSDIIKNSYQSLLDQVEELAVAVEALLRTCHEHFGQD